MNTPKKNEILEEIAKKRVPSSVDLWPQIYHQVKSGKNHARKPSNTPPLRRNSFFTAALLVILLITLPMTVPEVRARASQFIQRFGLVLIGPAPANVNPATAVSPSERPMPMEQKLEWISPEEAQALLPFPLPALKLVPEGLVLSGAMVTSGPHSTSCDQDGNCLTTGSKIEVSLRYTAVNNSLLNADASLMLTIYQGSPSGGNTAPESELQTVYVNGNEAAYIKGSWKQPENLDFSDGESLWESLEWDSSIDAGFVSWSDGVFTYLLSFYQLGLDKAAIIRIAESVTR